MSDAVSRMAPHFQAYPMFDRDPALTLTDRRRDDLASRSQSSAAFAAG
jgi:hypothetical protein